MISRFDENGQISFLWAENVQISQLCDGNVQISYPWPTRECGSNVMEGRAAGGSRDMGEVGVGATLQYPWTMGLGVTLQ